MALNQKVIIINDHLAVGWAGTKYVAAYLIKEISKLPSPCTANEILETIYGSGLTQKELESVSFIFFGASTDGDVINLFIQDYLTGQTVLSDGAKVKYAGSGQFHFLDSIAPQIIGTSGSVNEYESLIAAFISRMTIALVEEIFSDITHNFYYGGGFELLLFNPIEKRFVKQPLTFLFWLRRSDGIELTGPLLCQGYDKAGNLFIHRLWRTSDSLWNLKTYAITNILTDATAGALADFPQPDFNTFLTVHIFLREGNPKAQILIKKGLDKSLVVSLDPRSHCFEVSVGAGFEDELKMLLARP